MVHDMYDVIVQEFVEPGRARRFLGERTACRYCGASDPKVFGKQTNAHAFPAALGNRTLFALDECKACNDKFSIYEDALVKAIGPFLTLGGVRGRGGVRQTGRSAGASTIRHRDVEGKRQLSLTAEGRAEDLVGMDPATGILKLRMPVVGDMFVPRHAYKALLKIAISLLPATELGGFQHAIACLADRDAAPHDGVLRVGFSYAYVGNAPPALAGCLLRRKEDGTPIPYMLFLFMAGSVCFQIWLRPDTRDDGVPGDVRPGLQWTAQLPKPEGGYLPIKYSDPMQFNWTGLSLQLQPFEAFELTFNPRTTAGAFKPVLRG